MDYNKAHLIAALVRKRESLWELVKECETLLKENATNLDKDSCVVTIKVPLQFLSAIQDMASDGMERITEEIGKI